MKYVQYTKYSDPLLECVNRIPSHWEERKFRFLFSFGRGLGITKADLVDKGIPCINYGEIHSKYGFEVVPEKQDLKCVVEDYLEQSPACLLSTGDFVFADTSEDIEGSGNFTYLNSEVPTFAGYHTVIARQAGENQSRFLAYFIDCLIYRGQIRKNVSGVKVFSITQSILKDSYVWLPPLDEQQKIATFLDYKTQQIDQLIEKKKSLIEKLEEKRIAVITQAVTKGLDKNAKLKPSGVDWLGDVPEHWGVNRLRFLLSMNLTNGLFKTAEFWGRGKPIVNVFDAYVEGNIVKESSLDRVECDKDEYGKYSSLDGDFFFVRSSLKLDGVGKSVTIISPKEEVVFECHLVRGRPDQSKINPKFLNFYLNSKYAREYFVSVANVVTMATIDQMKLKNLILVMPALDEQNKIVLHVERVVLEINAMHKKTTLTIEKLNEYRSSLITSAVTGKIDVRQIAIPKEAA